MRIHETKLNCSDFFYYNQTSGTCTHACECTSFRISIEIVVIGGIPTALAHHGSGGACPIPSTIKRQTMKECF